jgi:hypothetical protein
VFQFQFSISIQQVDTNGQKRAKKSQKKRTPTPQNEAGGIIFISLTRYFLGNITVVFLLRSIKKGIVFRSVFTTIVGDNCERQKEKP